MHRPHRVNDRNKYAGLSNMQVSQTVTKRALKVVVVAISFDANLSVHVREQDRVAYIRCPTPLEIRSDYVCEACNLAVPVAEVMEQGEYSCDMASAL